MTHTNLACWRVLTVDDATQKGWRCIPALDGRPLGKWGSGQTYPLTDPLWGRANQVALVLGRSLLLDYDGGVPLPHLFTAIGRDEAFMRRHLVQYREGESDSLHWLFALPQNVTAATHKNNQDGVFLPGVDIKCMAQLIYLKPDKRLKLPPATCLPACPPELIAALEIRAGDTRSNLARISSPVVLPPGAGILERIKATAAADPLFWYEQLGMRVDKTGHAGCPKCGGRHRFSILPGGRFRCADCLPKGGSIIDFLVWRDGLTLKEAKNELAHLTHLTQILKI